LTRIHFPKWLLIFLSRDWRSSLRVSESQWTSQRAIADQLPPDLTAIFTKGNYSQHIDQFGTVARTAFDASGKRIGTQTGTYRTDAPNGMLAETTYLEPDPEHPLGQAFESAGNPMPFHLVPYKARTEPQGTGN
jgi:hypothetical protein